MPVRQEKQESDKSIIWQQKGGGEEENNYLIILSPIAVPLILYLVKGTTTKVIQKCSVSCF